MSQPPKINYQKHIDPLCLILKYFDELNIIKLQILSKRFYYKIVPICLQSRQIMRCACIYKFENGGLKKLMIDDVP